MPKIIILVGKPGSGKTTWAKKQAGYVIISRDHIKKSLFGEGYKKIPNHNKVLDETFYLILILLIKQKKNIICDRCNVDETYINTTMKMLTPDYEAEVKKFRIPFAVRCWRKLKRYINKKKNSVIKSFSYCFQ